MNNPPHAPLTGTHNRRSRGGHQEKRKRIKIQLTGFHRKGFLATSLSRERGVNKTASQQLSHHSPRWWRRATAWVVSAFTCARLKGLREACMCMAPGGGLGDSDGMERAGWGSVPRRWKERKGGLFLPEKLPCSFLACRWAYGNSQTQL